jgi:hypothetical protein
MKILLDIRGAKTSERPKILVSGDVNSKVNKTPESPTTEYLIKSSAFLKT